MLEHNYYRVLKPYLFSLSIYLTNYKGKYFSSWRTPAYLKRIKSLTKMKGILKERVNNFMNVIQLLNTINNTNKDSNK